MDVYVYLPLTDDSDRLLRYYATVSTKIIVEERDARLHPIDLEMWPMVLVSPDGSSWRSYKGVQDWILLPPPGLLLEHTAERLIESIVYCIEQEIDVMMVGHEIVGLNNNTVDDLVCMDGTCVPFLDDDIDRPPRFRHDPLIVLR
jgi:hypothetical protein